MKRVKKPSDVPVGYHFAVIIYNTTSVYIEGDERSRTNPGHGYPAHTETYDSFEHWVTEYKDRLNAFVEKHIEDASKMIILEVNKKSTITTKIVLSIE